MPCWPEAQRTAKTLKPWLLFQGELLVRGLQGNVGAFANRQCLWTGHTTQRFKSIGWRLLQRSERWLFRFVLVAMPWRSSLVPSPATPMPSRPTQRLLPATPGRIA
jgi:hypothetical protein